MTMGTDGHEQAVRGHRAIIDGRKVMLNVLVYKVGTSISFSNYMLCKGAFHEGKCIAMVQYIPDQLRSDWQWLS